MTCAHGNKWTLLLTYCCLFYKYTFLSCYSKLSHKTGIMYWAILLNTSFQDGLSFFPLVNWTFANYIAEQHKMHWHQAFGCCYRLALGEMSLAVSAHFVGTQRCTPQCVQLGIYWQSLPEDAQEWISERTVLLLMAYTGTVCTQDEVGSIFRPVHADSKKDPKL